MTDVPVDNSQGNGNPLANRFDGKPFRENHERSSTSSSYRYDLSIVLNLHDENGYVNRTMQSLKEAIQFVSCESVDIELIIVLDCADAETAAFAAAFDMSCVLTLQIIETEVSSLGLARNIGCSAARGEWIALCDGDDLVSYNYFTSCLSAARHYGSNTLLMPQWYFGFGERWHFCEFVPLETVTPLAFFDIHPYGSRTFAHATLFDAIPFFDASASTGHAFEDWHHNSEVVAAGLDIQIAKDAAIFYRQRTSGIMGSVRGSQWTQQIPISSLFKPEVFILRCNNAVKLLLGGDDPRGQYPPAVGRAVFQDAMMLAYMSAANNIDPGVDPVELRDSPEYHVRAVSNLDIGIAYFELCGRLENQLFSDIVVSPMSPNRSGDPKVICLVERLVRKDRSVLVLMVEIYSTCQEPIYLPNDAKICDLHAVGQRINTEAASLIALKLIQSYPDALVHIIDCDFGHHFIRRFGRNLADRIVFYILKETRRMHGGASFIYGRTFIFVSENIQYFSRVVTEDVETVLLYTDRLGNHIKSKFCIFPPQ